MSFMTRLLILGGSWFLGRAIADAATAQQWDVTIFRRGRAESGADPANVRTVRGDYGVPRDVARLADHGPFDLVVDNLAFTPRETLATAAALEPHFGCASIRPRSDETPEVAEPLRQRLGAMLGR